MGLRQIPSQLLTRKHSEQSAARVFPESPLRYNNNRDFLLLGATFVDIDFF